MQSYTIDESLRNKFVSVQIAQNQNLRIPHLHNKAMPPVHSPIQTSPIANERCSNYLKAHQEFSYPSFANKI